MSVPKTNAPVRVTKKLYELTQAVQGGKSCLRTAFPHTQLHNVDVG